MAYERPLKRMKRYGNKSVGPDIEEIKETATRRSNAVVTPVRRAMNKNRMRVRRNKYGV